MKTEELKSKGLSQEQIDFVMAENGKDLKTLQEENKTLTADRDNWQKKAEKAEGNLGTVKEQLKDAQETIKGFDGVDIEKLNKDIAEWKERAEKAKKDADARILERDQRDWLNNKLGKDGYDVKSPRAKESIISDVLSGKTGAKWDVKTQQYFGIDDLMKSEKERDSSLYETAEEKAEAEAREKAAGSAPKYTDKSEPKQAEAKDTSPVPMIF